MNKLRALISTLLLAVVAIMPVAPALALGNNLLANPSLETANGALPANWQKDNWGTNTATYTYETTGHTGGRSVTVKLSGYKTGDAKWYATPVAVTADTQYTFSDWYKSTVKSSVDAVITTTAGKTTYKNLGDAAASAAWKQTSFSFKTPAAAKNVTFYHYIEANGSLTTDDYNFALTAGTTDPTPPTPPAPTPTAPTVQLTSPVANATVVGTQTVAATAGDAKGVSSVQFKLDGANLGAADTTAPYSVSWDTKTATNGSHALTAVATNTSNLTTTATNVAVTVNNPPAPTAPTVQITTPTTGATVAGAQSVTATASGVQAITSVQFKLDGANLGTADTTAPYAAAWDTTTAVNGVHTLTAVATNSANLTATATNVSVTVNNQVPTPPTPPTPPAPTPTNLIVNPSVETASGAVPASWIGDGWGTNAHTTTYENTGRTGTHSVKTTITSYTDGDAKWYFADVPVTAGKTYAYSNWYKSSADSELDAMVTMQDGTVQYFWLGATIASPTTWTQAKAQFQAPVNAKSVVIFQVLAKVGYVQSDDFSLSEYTPAQFNRALVSLTFDDAWRNIYTNGLPLLQKYNMVSTQYLLTQPTVDAYPDYMTIAMMKAFQAQGSEIASHTVDHEDLATLTTAQIDTELSKAQTQLRAWLGTAGVANNFATPYGSYNANALTEIKKYYRSHRSVESGYNSKDNFDIYDIKVQNIDNTTTPATVQAWVNQALATKTWLVLVYHEVATNPEDNTYSVTPANLDSELNIIKQSGITVKTVSQALDEIQPQL